MDEQLVFPLAVSWIALGWIIFLILKEHNPDVRMRMVFVAVFTAAVHASGYILIETFFALKELW